MDFSPKEILFQMFKSAAKSCKKCELSSLRKNVVVGDGSVYAPLMIVGEAPGQNEDEQGIPFVGKAGDKLDEILKYFGMERDKDVYITNAVLCRPPNNRAPLYDEEIVPCFRRLMSQIYLLKPKVILGLGAASAQALLGNDICKKVGSLGALFSMDHEIILDDFKCPIVFSYHPSYLLRKKGDKEIAAKALEHWKQVMGILKQTARYDDPN